MGNHRASDARHTALAAAILRHAQTQGWRRGHRLTELELSAALSVSRTPVRAALRRLAGAGFVIPHSDRGFVLAVGGRRLSDAKLDEPDTAEAELHAALVKDRIAGRLPQIVGQAELARRYGAGRPLLTRVLTRMQHEGLISRAQGQGWTFVPTLESEASRRASFEFRLAIEPAGLQLPGFCLDRVLLARLRAEHLAAVRRLKHGISSPAAIFALDVAFHEGLAEMSGNPFILATVRQQNTLRKLLELASYSDVARVRSWISEHLTILEHVETGDMGNAATAMQSHLRAAAGQATV